MQEIEMKVSWFGCDMMTEYPPLELEILVIETSKNIS